MKLYNTDEDIYGNKQVIFDDEDNVYRCPVCLREFKKQSSAEKHLVKQCCHGPQQVFAGTKFEDAMFRLYNRCIAHQFVNIYIFRESKGYKPIARFFLFCIEHKISNPEEYAEFSFLSSGKNELHALNLAQNKNMLGRYRMFLIENYSLINSERFFAANAERLSTDLTVVCDALERADIAFQYLKKKIKFEVLENMVRCSTPIEQMRFEKFCYDTKQRSGV